MELIDISKIKINSKSRNRYDSLKKGNLKKSIEKYGQLKPIVVNEDLELIEGHNVLEILILLKYNKAWIVIPKISNNSKQLYSELNLLQGEPQPIEYFKCFKESEEDTCIPFSKQDIFKFIELLNFDLSKYKEDRKNPNVEFIF